MRRWLWLGQSVWRYWKMIRVEERVFNLRVDSGWFRTGRGKWLSSVSGARGYDTPYWDSSASIKHRQIRCVVSHAQLLNLLPSQQLSANSFPGYMSNTYAHSDGYLSTPTSVTLVIVFAYLHFHSYIYVHISDRCRYILQLESIISTHP
jgi:hypothetical protein